MKKNLTIAVPTLVALSLGLTAGAPAPETNDGTAFAQMSDAAASTVSYSTTYAEHTVPNIVDAVSKELDRQAQAERKAELAKVEAQKKELAEKKAAAEKKAEAKKKAVAQKKAAQALQIQRTSANTPVASTTAPSADQKRMTTEFLNLRASGSASSTVFTVLPKGAEVSLLGKSDGRWVAVKYKGTAGWVSSDYLTTVKSAAKKAAATTKKASAKKSSASNASPVQAKSVKRASSVSSSGAYTRDSANGVKKNYTHKKIKLNTAKESSGLSGVVSAARSGIGTPYVFGGKGTSGWDCSGFTAWAYAQAGYSIPSSTKAILASGKFKPTNNPQPGDLVFQNGNGHVGIYVGNGQMIGAQNPSVGTLQHSVNRNPISGYYTLINK